MSIIFTACLYVAVLPPDQGVHSVAPRSALYPAPVPAEVARVLHLGEDRRGRGVGVGLGGVPGLTLQPALSGVLPALVKPAITLHTRGCKPDNNNVFKMTSFYSKFARGEVVSHIGDA